MILVGAEKAGTLAAIHAEAFDRPWDAAALADLLAAEGVFALIDAASKGFILMRVILDEAEILTLAVTPSARRQGLGRRLLQDAAALAASHGAEGLFLEVAADNLAALALYEGAGFISAGRRAAYYARSPGPAIDALVLKMPLGRTA